MLERSSSNADRCLKLVSFMTRGHQLWPHNILAANSFLFRKSCRYLGGNQLCSVADAQCIGQNSPASPTTPYNPPFGPGSGGSSDKDRLAKIIGGVGGGLIFLLLLLAVLAWYISEKRWSRRDKERRSVFRERLNLANLGKYTGGLAKRDWKKG